MPKRSTMELILCMQKFKEKQKEKKRNISMGFIHLNMVYDKGGLEGGISDSYKSKKGFNGICKNTGYVR